MTYSLRVMSSVREVPPAAWERLVGEHSSPFVEYEWLDALEQTGCVGAEVGWLPAHLSLYNGRELVAAAPCYAKGHSEGEFVFDWSWADLADRIGVEYYPKFVVAVPFTPATGDRVLVAPGEDRARATAILAEAARERCGRTGASGVHVLFPHDDEARRWQERGYLRRTGFQFHWFRHGATRFDEYLARFSSKHRNQIKRELRGVADAGVSVETLEPGAHTPAVVEAMYRFYESTIDKHGVWGRLYLTRAFFTRIVDRFRERLAWVIARDQATGEIVGGAFNIVGGKRLYGRYWGASRELPFLHFVVCYYAGIRFCIERGLDVFEPGAGGEHKRARGFVPTLTHSAHWLEDPRMRRVLAPWLAREEERVHAFVTGPDG